MAKPIISVIVPVYNVEKYLSKCMDSLVKQTFEEIEIITVNDGSTDSSLEVLMEYARKDGRIKVIDKLNEGVSVARNTALEQISGDYVMFVDSDDWIDLDTCEKTLQTMQKYNCDVVIWSYIREFSTHSVPKIIFEQDIIFHKSQVSTDLHRRFAGGIGKELAKPENLDALCTIWGKLYKASIIKQNNIKFEDIRNLGTYEDGIFNLYLFKHVDKAVFMNKYFYHYRKDNSISLTTQYKPRFKEQWFALFDLIDDYITRNSLDDSIFKQALANRIAVSMLGLGLNEINNTDDAFAKITCIKSILNETRLRKAYNQLNLNCFPLHWKIFFVCAKHNFAAGVYLLLVAIQKIILR